MSKWILRPKNPADLIWSTLDPTPIEVEADDEVSARKAASEARLKMIVNNTGLKVVDPWSPHQPKGESKKTICERVVDCPNQN